MSANRGITLGTKGGGLYGTGFTYDPPQTLTVQGAISGVGGLTIGTGVILTGANTYAGSTTINRGGSLTVTGSIRGSTSIQSTGTLILGGTGGGTPDLINDNASFSQGDITINCTLRIADTRAGFTEVMGSLGGIRNSTLDFGLGSDGAIAGSGNTLSCSGISFGTSAGLTVRHWSGSMYDPGAVNVDPGTDTRQDRLLVRSLNGLTAGQDVHVYFYGDAGNALGPGRLISYGSGGYEVVPVPEPAAGSTLLLLAVWDGIVRPRRR